MGFHGIFHQISTFFPPWRVDPSHVPPAGYGGAPGGRHGQRRGIPPAELRGSAGPTTPEHHSAVRPKPWRPRAAALQVGYQGRGVFIPFLDFTFQTMVVIYIYIYIYIYT